MGGYLYGYVRIVVEHLDQGVERLLGFLAQGVAGEVEEDVVDRYWLKHGRQHEILLENLCLVYLLGGEIRLLVEVTSARAEHYVFHAFLEFE